MARKPIVNQIIYGLDADANPTGVPAGTIFIQETTIKHYNGSTWVLLHAPIDAQYVTLATDGTLSAERTLAVAKGLKMTDGGAGNAVTLEYNPSESWKKWIVLWDDMTGPTYSSNVATPFQAIISGTGATVPAVDTDDNSVFGVQALTTGTTSTGRAAIMSSSTLNTFPLGQGEAIFVCKIKIPVLSNGTQRFQIKAGFMDDHTTPTDGVYFLYDDASSANWKIVTVSNGTSTGTNVATSTAVSTSYVELKIIVNAAGTSAAFYINGVQVTNSPLTSNIPTGFARAVGIGTTMNKSVGSTSMVTNVDFMGMTIELTTPRIM